MKFNQDYSRKDSEKILNYLIGIDVPSFLREEIVYFKQKQMKKFDNQLNWFPSQDYHITLAYIGKITQTQRQRLISIADKIIVPPFKIQIQGLGFFPPGKNPKNLQIRIGRGRDVIKNFARRIHEDISQKAGLIPKNVFSPHITIAKLSQIQNNDLFKFVKNNWDYPFGDFTIKSFHLYRLTKWGYVHNHEVKLKNISINLNSKRF